MYDRGFRNVIWSLKNYSLTERHNEIRKIDTLHHILVIKLSRFQHLSRTLSILHCSLVLISSSSIRYHLLLFELVYCCYGNFLFTRIQRKLEIKFSVTE